MSCKKIQSPMLKEKIKQIKRAECKKLDWNKIKEEIFMSIAQQYHLIVLQSDGYILIIEQQHNLKGIYKILSYAGIGDRNIE